MIVVDASVLATALVDRGDDGRRARSRLDEADGVHTPHLCDLEVAARLRRGVAAGAFAPDRAARALRELASTPLVRYPHMGFLERIWQLRHNLTSYDAAYVALAELLDVVLITADARLTRAPGPRCPIELLA